MTTPETPSVTYIETRKGEEFSELILQDLEIALNLAGARPLKGHAWPSFWDVFGRSFAKLRLTPPRLSGAKTTSIIGLMGLAERQLHPYGALHEIVPFVWDCWPSREAEWRDFIRRYALKRIAFTSSQAAEFWSAEFPDIEILWLPEAIDEALYLPGPSLSSRSTCVLEIGRRYAAGHDMVRETLERLGRQHRFKDPLSPMVFLPTRADLISALQASQALLCYPGAVSHPDGRTGHWESMTHRYLEAVATKTLIVGHVPQEMTTLFGFCPGVNVSLSELPDLLKTLTDSPHLFQDRVDRAHSRLLEVGTWEVRVQQLMRFARASD
ncbi:glycosyltransferase family 1 protein [Cryobacterium cheniae]|uniref:Glycosyltransferase family 1 protein n=1 Tax=Cryobacterium cheniae TaxID=1259262 RepID=A0A4R8XVS4_9MICO|nr:glycosyltransferase family 1 protein [Cryobacterium cheniae]TFC82993.1 glycosyltransferase family 1 protein [Cryobacterium cheniae]